MPDSLGSVDPLDQARREVELAEDGDDSLRLEALERLHQSLEDALSAGDGEASPPRP